MNSVYRKPDQIVQPFWFGDSASKKTCLWLHNLPPLEATNIVDPGERVVLSSGRSLPNGIQIHSIRRFQQKKEGD